LTDNPPFDTTEPGELFPGSVKATTKAVRTITTEQEHWSAAFWSEYWLHKGKKAAREAFCKHVQAESRFREIMAAIRAQAPEMLNRQPEHRPHAATWLNGERWMDEAATVAPKLSPGQAAVIEAARRMEEKKNDQR
jgi:hypothetical protein